MNYIVLLAWIFYGTCIYAINWKENPTKKPTPAG